ncbi:MAG: SDR family oxidoreductase [Pirellulales bacterium]
MDLGLNDETAVVIGGASGIGLATAECFLREGARVEIWDRAPAESFELPARSASFSHALRYRQLDVTDQQACFDRINEAVSASGTVHHAVLTAAIGSGKFGFPYTNLNAADWPRILEINIMGMVHVAHSIGPVLRDQGHGTMTFLGSIAGQIGSQTDPPYSASKAANINFMQCIAKDLAPFGIRVNLVNPGMVQTPLNRSVWQAWHDGAPPEQRRSYEEWAGDKVKRMVPLGRWQTPDDVADMIVFLSSRRANNVTGQCINVDGGFVMRG